MLVENESNELSEKTISTKGLTKYLINKFNILNGAKTFFFKDISKLFTIYTSWKIH